MQDLTRIENEWLQAHEEYDEYFDDLAAMDDFEKDED